MTKVIARVHPVHLMNVDWTLSAANPQTKPVDLGCESAENWQLASTSVIAIVIITQPSLTGNAIRNHIRVVLKWIRSSRSVSPKSTVYEYNVSKYFRPHRMQNTRMRPGSLSGKGAFGEISSGPLCGVSGVGSIFSSLFGRWQQRCSFRRQCYSNLF